LAQFGEIDIDSELVAFKENVDGDQTIMMLNNGCLCCTVRDDLLDMLGELVGLSFLSGKALHGFLNRLCTRCPPSVGRVSCNEGSLEAGGPHCPFMRHDAVDGMQVSRKDKFDHVVIETTGLADPQPIIETFYAFQVTHHVIDGNG
jgi:G3E family GTPase